MGLGIETKVVVNIPMLFLLIALFAPLKAAAFGEAFDKPIDQAKVQQVLNLTSQEDLLKIIQNDLKLYRIESSVEHTGLASQINTAISNLEKTPDIIVTTIGQGILNKLLGLFLPFEEHANIIKKDVILFRADAGAWTVTHEYLHFLFNKERRQNGNQDNPNFKSILEDSTETYNEMLMVLKQNNNSFSQAAQRDEYILAVQNILQNKMNNILNFSIEEILIEQRLQQHFSQQKLNLFSLDDYEYSFKYVQKNLKLAVRETEYILNLITEAKKVLAPGMPQTLKNELDLYFKKYEKILQALPKPTPVEEKKQKTVETVFA